MRTRKDRGTVVEFFEDLPVGRGPRAMAEREFAAALRARPGEWAAYPGGGLKTTTLHNYRHLIATGRKPGLGHGFESAIRGGVLYVRYAGGGR